MFFLNNTKLLKDNCISKAQQTMFTAAPSQSPELAARDSHDIQADGMDGDAFMHVTC